MRLSGRREVLRGRGAVYSLGLSAGLLAAFAVVWSGGVGPLPVRVLHFPVLLCIAVASGALMWLRPRAGWYAAGLLSTLAALVCYWVASPMGGAWVARVADDPNFSGSRYAAASMLLFALAWLLLARSVARWRLALGSYLAAGAVFVLFGAVATAGPEQNAATWLLLAAGALIWPYYSLLLLGVFGWTLR